jgi:hypothetical protein
MANLDPGYNLYVAMQHNYGSAAKSANYRECKVKTLMEASFPKGAQTFRLAGPNNVLDLFS